MSLAYRRVPTTLACNPVILAILKRQRLDAARAVALVLYLAGDGTQQADALDTAGKLLDVALLLRPENAAMAQAAATVRELAADGGRWRTSCAAVVDTGLQTAIGELSCASASELASASDKAAQRARQPGQPAPGAPICPEVLP